MATKTLSPVMRIVIGAMILILAVYGYRFYISVVRPKFSVSSSPAGLEPSDKSEKSPVALLPNSQSADKSRTKIEMDKPGQPKFHILRVEEEGSVTIAGSAFANSLVEIILNGKAVASTTASNNGDFAMVLDESLKPGAHELYIRSTDGEGASILSMEVGIVNIPEQGNELIAMVTKPGESSRVTQMPETAMEHESGEKSQSRSQLIKTDKKDSEIGNDEEMKQAMIRPILLKSVEIEESRLFVTGTGEPGHTINLYIDNRFIGQAIIDPLNVFFLEKNLKLEFGNRVVRVDMLEKDGTKVIARAETPFIHSASSDPGALNGQVSANTHNLELMKPEKSIRAGSSVIIRKGDNLWHLSQRILGHGIKYITIYNANKGQIKNPDLIFPGQIFRIPKAKEENTKNN